MTPVPSTTVRNEVVQVFLFPSCQDNSFKINTFCNQLGTSAFNCGDRIFPSAEQNIQGPPFHRLRAQWTSTIPGFVRLIYKT